MAKGTRRDLIKSAGAVAGGALVTGCMGGLSTASEPGAASPRRRKALTVAHLTDIHVKPEGKGPAGMRACLRHVQARNPKPDLILNGGDSIMDALGASEDRTRVQWDLWNQILAEECRLPIVHCIGNHDIWGWQMSKAGVTGSEPRFGKVWAMEALELEKPYYSFNRAGWHFIVLDSVQYRGDEAYKPMLDDEQFEWLEGDLASVDPATPILFLSHVPILSATPYFFKDDVVKDHQFRVPGALMHQDVHRIKTLFLGYPNIRLCLSGHVHLADRVDYNGITYLCNGAVSGSWWYGPYKDTPPGYGLVTLYDDGSFDHEYVLYPWDPEAEATGSAT